MLVKTKSIVLHAMKYGDTSLIVEMYTEKHGRLSVMLKGIYGKKAKTGPSYFHPLNILESDLYFIPGRNFQHVKEVRFDYPYTSVPFNIRKSAIALFLSEVLKKTLTEEIKNPELFTWLKASLQILDQLNEDFSDFHLAFIIRLCRYLGFTPRNNYSYQNRFFDLREGLFTFVHPPHPDVLDKSLAHRFSVYLNTPLGEKTAIQKDKTLTGILLGKMLEYYYIHLQGMGEIKSLDVLQDVFR